MKVESQMPDNAVLCEIGVRIARLRLNKNITQKILAKEAGVSLPTLQRIEQGSSSNTVNLIRVLRALNMLENIDILIPELPVSPMMQLEMHKRTRSRASAKKERKSSDTPWNWGDKE